MTYSTKYISRIFLKTFYWFGEHFRVTKILTHFSYIPPIDPLSKAGSHVSYIYSSYALMSHNDCISTFKRGFLLLILETRKRCTLSVRLQCWSIQVSSWLVAHFQQLYLHWMFLISSNIKNVWEIRLMYHLKHPWA